MCEVQKTTLNKNKKNIHFYLPGGGTPGRVYPNGKTITGCEKSRLIVRFQMEISRGTDLLEGA